MKFELDEATATLSRAPAALKAMLTYGNQKHLCSIDHNEEDYMRRARVASWQEPRALFPSPAHTID
jgi:hypothetical protein